MEEKKERIQQLVFKIIDESSVMAAAAKIADVIMAKRMHIDGMDGLVALQQNWTENQCRLLIEMLS